LFYETPISSTFQDGSVDVTQIKKKKKEKKKEEKQKMYAGFVKVSQMPMVNLNWKIEIFLRLCSNGWIIFKIGQFKLEGEKITTLKL